VIEFGYGLSAVRDLATANGTGREFAKIGGTVLAGRIALALPATIILLGAQWILEFSPALLAATIALSLSYGLTPSWFFIGTERAWLLASIELAIAIAQLILIVAFANSPQVALIMLGAPVTAFALIGNIFATYKHGIDLPGPARLRSSISKSFQFFCFTGLASTLARSHIFMLAAMSTPTQVAYFAIADRILTAASNMTIPVVRVFLPRISSISRHSPEDARRTFYYVTVSLVALSSFGAISGALFSPWAVPALFGEDVRDASHVVATLLFAIPPLLAARLIGTLGLVPLHHESIYQRIALATAALGIVAAPLGIWLGQGIGLAVTRILVELLGAAACAIAITKLGDWMHPRRPSIDGP
jgi:O-antigen/teichoic acid export membrane protein